VNHSPSCSLSLPPRHRVRGFTLIEIMIVVVIIGVLSAIALPLYGDYVLRGRIPDATSNLSALSVKMEQAFQDNRSYLIGADCAIKAVPTTDSKSFTFACKPRVAGTTDTFLITATGTGTMSEFAYTIDERGTKGTPKAKTGWGTSTTCWTTNKGGC
jgi:type IV pilus assembly protein PilE